MSAYIDLRQVNSELLLSIDIRSHTKNAIIIVIWPTPPLHNFCFE